jgi:hypothetical protein
VRQRREGIIRGFAGQGQVMAIRIEVEEGCSVFLIGRHVLARAVGGTESCTSSALQNLVGARCEFVEDEFGVVVELAITHDGCARGGRQP